MADPVKPAASTEKIDPVRATDCFIITDATGPVLVFRRAIFTMEESGCTGVPTLSAAVSIPWALAEAVHAMLGKQIEDAKSAAPKPTMN